MVELLNKLVAICKCGAGSYKELAKFLGKTQQQVNEWLVQRTHAPSGSTTMQMQVWAASKTLAIAAVDKDLQTKYRTQYRLVCGRFPLLGRKES